MVARSAQFKRSTEKAGAAGAHPARSPRSATLDLLRNPADTALLAEADPLACLQHLRIPWRLRNGRMIFAAAKPAADNERRAAATDIRRAVAAVHGRALERRACTLTAARFSCRNRGHPVLLAATITGWGWALSTISVQQLFATILGGLALLALATAGFRLASAAATLARPLPTAPALAASAAPAFTLLVPLLRESAALGGLIAALERLDYPRAKLQILLLIEADDPGTRAALNATALPEGAEVLTVPTGRLKTKPRAMNFALPFCSGELVGIYDAEDRPEADQLQKVASHFAQAPATLACVQGILDFRNAAQNWLTRCFAIEYAVWFRVVLRGARALGMPIPLGGTTVFFRRAALEAVGGWDAHNVTEDADLGMRLARFGYHTDVLATTTLEEATNAPATWVRQRSRWMKGFAQTWATHMREPVRLMRDLGPLGFLAFQVLFLGSWVSFLAIPLFATLSIARLAGVNPLAAVPTWLAGLFVAAMLISQFATFATSFLALRRRGSLRLMLLVPTLPVYWPLATLAACKALFELLYRPFFWDKTRHDLRD